MGLPRILEPEIMSEQDEVLAYDAMDHREVNRQFVDDLVRVQSEPGDVLDVGTGTALIPIELARRELDCRIWATDLSIPMLEMAKIRLELSSTVAAIRLVHADATALPFPDEHFDTVISNSLIHHLPSPLGALREMVRVIRPGGLVMVRDLLRPESDAALNELVSQHASNEPELAQQLFKHSLHAALTAAELSDLVSSLGATPATVQITSDRHWTWTWRKDAPSSLAGADHS